MPTVTIKLTDAEYAAFNDPALKNKYLSRSDMIRTALHNLWALHKLKPAAREAIKESRSYHAGHQPRTNYSFRKYE